MTDDLPPPFAPAARAAGLHALGEGTEDLRVSLERHWENLLDWEHLPYLHPGSFRAVTRLEGGRWWWRARVESALGGNEVTLVIDPDLAEWGIEIGGRVYVHLRAERLAPRHLRVHARFSGFAAPRDEGARRGIFRYFKDQFDRLAVEDGRAMEARQDALDHLAAGTTDDLGTAAEARARAPFVARWRGTRFWIRPAGEGFRADAADCPHLLGPLPCPGSGPTVCPWHGYAFDADTGRSCDGRGLRVRSAPALVVADGRLAWSAPARVDPC